VTDKGQAYLQALPRLEFLGLRMTQVTDAGLTHLRGLASLKFLHLKGTRTTAAGVRELKKALPRLTVYRSGG
jgi:hypothetical protein